MPDGTSNKGELPKHTASTCYCRCHWGAGDPASSFPLRNDPIGAATACSQCRKLHVLAFIDTKEEDAA